MESKEGIMFDEYLIARLFCAFFVGGLISLNGSFAQILTQNPLAAPSTLGIQAFALLLYLLGFVLGKVFDYENYQLVSIVLFHLVFPLFFLFYRSPKPGLLKKMILFGICLNLFVASVYSLVQFILLNLGVQFPSELWFGNFRFALGEYAFFMGVLFITSLLFVIKDGKKLRIYVLGKDFADSYLSQPEKLERNIFLLMTYTMCLCTFLFGYFSFLGLVFPHLIRGHNLFRKDVFYELIGGTLIGGLFFMLIDGSCYHFLINGAELPIGMVTAVLGPLAFLILLLVKRETIKSVY